MDVDSSSSCISEYDEARVKEIISRDNKDEFISFLASSSLMESGGMVKLKFGEYEVSPYKILVWICDNRAVRCGTALVEENPLDLKLDLNVPIDQGAFPLHEAAWSLSSGLIELFLRHGAQADVNIDIVKDTVSIPLTASLGRARELIRWTPRQSVFKLIIMLCLPKMKEALETNRMLAWNTKEFKEVLRYCAVKGGVIELAILLMVAREKFKTPIAFQSEDGSILDECMTFHKCINCLLAEVIDLEFSSIGEEKGRHAIKPVIKKMKVGMVSTLQLLEIFERAGDAIEAYLNLERTCAPKEQVAQEVAGLLAESGVVLNSKDTDLGDIVDCYPAELVLERSGSFVQKQKKGSEVLAECGSQREHYRMPLYSQTGSYFDAYQKLRYGVREELWRLPSIRFPGGSSVIKPLFANWMWKSGFCTGAPKIMGLKEGTKEIEQSLTFSLSKQWASFALAFRRRGIRGI